MERKCEFCGAPRPVVYCQADAAFLCLSCDAKVHSANALSGRHSRDLLCDSCKENTAFVRCIDHLMLLCRRCESHLHDVFSAHKKLMLKSFTGCPSAQHFASLWGLNVSEETQFSARGDRFGSESCVSSDRCNVKFKNSGSAKTERGLSSKQHKNNHKKEPKNSLIVQQILDLKKLQLTECENQSSPTLSSSGKVDEGLSPQLKELDSFNSDLESFSNPSQALENEDFPSPISQLDHLSCSSLGGALGSSQFWSQNLQDLGVCEDLGHSDDFDMPDVDLSFRNFEELFANDVSVTHPLLEDSNLMWSGIAKEASIDESENSHVKTTEDASGASSISFNNDITSKDEEHKSDHIAHGTFSQSLLSAESSGIDCLDSGHSGNFTEAECGDNSRKISQERKKSRLQGKRSQLGGGKEKSNTRQRIKGRFVNVGGHESDTVNVTKSY